MDKKERYEDTDKNNVEDKSGYEKIGVRLA
jgi:hypothetical protein